VKDWDKVNFADRSSIKLLEGAVNYFLSAPFENKEIKKAIQQFGQSGDFPASVLEILEKYNVTPDYDLAFEEIFDIRDFTGSNRNGFKILDVESGITFVEVPVGGSAKLAKMAGEQITVNFAKYGGGLQWDRTLIDDKEYWTLEDNAIAFRNRAAYDRAAAFYALIEALPNTCNVAWQAPVPATLSNTDANYAAIRDIETINAACQAILTDCRNKGYGISPNSQFIILAPIQLRARITRALGLLNASLSGTNFNGVLYNATPRFTMMLSATNKFYVCLPKIKAKGGNRMNLTIFTRFEETQYSDIAVGWMRFGGAIGDVEQFKRCSTA